MKEMMIDFPAQDEIQNAKLEKLLKDMEDFMDTSIGIEKLTILRVKYDASRVELGSILQRLAGNKTGLRQNKAPRKISTKPLQLSEMQMEKNIDPLGS